jgi:methionine--tRNA ligase beta chain
MTETIQFPEWQKLDLRVGKILKVEDIEGADKLYKFEIDLGKLGKRIIAAGIKQHYNKKELQDKNVVVLVNLEPKTLRGIQSQGMILAAVEEKNGDEKISLISPEKDVEPGTKIS